MRPAASTWQLFAFFAPCTSRPAKSLRHPLPAPPVNKDCQLARWHQPSPPSQPLASPALPLLPCPPAACICYARAVGTPVYSFQVESGEGSGLGEGWTLAYRTPDPLHAAGGLAAVSEGGRLASAGGEGPDEEVGSDIER